MPQDLKDFPRPPNDNGRGLHGSMDAAWTGGESGYDYWINLLIALNVKWFKVLDDGGNSIPFCEKLLTAGIFPIVRILRRDPPPNDSPEPNPGHIGAPEEKTIQRLIAAGVQYFETNNEPNLTREWKQNAIPGNLLEAAKLVALNWLFDARLILSMGGYPGLPAIGNGGDLDLMGALVALGRQDILLEGCWLALHNYTQNRPLHYPDDSVNRSGQPLTTEEYNVGANTAWVWWNPVRNRANTLDEINEMRANSANPAPNLAQDHAGFREFEYYNSLAMKYLGRSIPIISTEGGYRVGRREDLRYPRTTPDMHRQQTVALFDFMQRQAPDYYFAAVPSVLIPSDENEPDAWHSSFWQRATKQAPFGYEGVPNNILPDASVGEHLPVLEAVKAMQNLARRLPGTPPTPPVEQTLPAQPRPVIEKVERVVPLAQPVEPQVEEKIKVDQPEPARASQPDVAWWLRDAPTPAAQTSQPTAEPIAPTVAEKIEAEPVAQAARDEQPQIETSTPVVEQAQEQVAQTIEPTIAEPITPIVEPVREFAQPTVEEKIIEPIVVPVAPASLAPPPPPEHYTSIEPVAETATLALASIPDELEWDWRLDALGIQLQTAEVKPGQSYWKLVRAIYQAPDEAQDNHQVYYVVADQFNKPIEYQKVMQAWSDGETEAITNERGETNIPLWAGYSPDRSEQGAYSAWVDGLPSDRVIGMGLPQKRHVCFVLTWKRTIVTYLRFER